MVVITNSKGLKITIMILLLAVSILVIFYYYSRNEPFALAVSHETTLSCRGWREDRSGTPTLVYLNDIRAKVGIGTTTPQAKLEVDGNIVQKSFITQRSANALGYDLGVKKIGANSIFGYDAMCVGNSAGDCSGTGGVVIKSNEVKINGTGTLDVGGKLNASGEVCLGGVCKSSWPVDARRISYRVQALEAENKVGVAIIDLLPLCADEYGCKIVLSSWWFSGSLAGAKKKEIRFYMERVGPGFVSSNGYGWYDPTTGTSTYGRNREGVATTIMSLTDPVAEFKDTEGETNDGDDKFSLICKSGGSNANCFLTVED